jgi:hypothetical protein
MGKDKSIIEKFAETMKGLADSAAEALKAEEPPRADATAAVYMPFAAEGLVADPLLVPPLAAQPVRPRKGAAKKTARRRVKSKKSTPTKPVRKGRRKSAKTARARLNKRTAAKKPANKSRRR